MRKPAVAGSTFDVFLSLSFFCHPVQVTGFDQLDLVQPVQLFIGLQALPIHDAEQDVVVQPDLIAHAANAPLRIHPPPQLIGRHVDSKHIKLLIVSTAHKGRQAICRSTEECQIIGQLFRGLAVIPEATVGPVLAD